jgi:hypothetical protein
MRWFLLDMVALLRFCCGSVWFYRTGSMRGIERSVALSPVLDTSAKLERRNIQIRLIDSVGLLD